MRMAMMVLPLLLIVVGVAMDTMRQLESHLVTRHYEGFMKKRGLR